MIPKLIVSFVSILYAVLEFTGFLPFLGIDVSLILSGTPKALNILVVFLFPLLLIIFGVLIWPTTRAGVLGLFVVYGLYFVISIIGVAKMAFWERRGLGVGASLHDLEVVAVANSIFYFVLLGGVILYARASRRSLEQT